MRSAVQFDAARIVLTVGAALCLTLSSGCVGMMVMEIRTLAIKENYTPIFEPDPSNPLHAQLDPEVAFLQSLVELPDGSLIGATRLGVVFFDRRMNVTRSYLLHRSHDQVRLVDDAGGPWVVARTRSRNPPYRLYHIYDLEQEHPSHELRCRTGSVDPSVVKFDADRRKILVLPCRETVRDALYFVNPDYDEPVRLEIPKYPRRALVGRDVEEGDEFLLLLHANPSIKNVALGPVNQVSLEHTDMFDEIDMVKQTEQGQFRITPLNDLRPDSRYIAQRFWSPGLVVHGMNEGSMSIHDSVYPGNVVLRWQPDGTLSGWWYIATLATIRSFRHWLDVESDLCLHDAITPETAGEKEFCSVVVGNGFGHWCEWKRCGDTILQIGERGWYREIDFTRHPITAVLVTKDNHLLAVWKNRIYEYDLKTHEGVGEWQQSVVPEGDLDWMSKHSGMSGEQIRAQFDIVK